MNRIEKKLQTLQEKKEKAFITYITAGLPDMEHCAKLIRAQEEAELDILELGIPFSDPAADGPVIQDASYRSILKGTNCASVLNWWRESQRWMRTADRIYDVLQYRASLWTGGVCGEVCRGRCGWTHHPGSSTGRAAAVKRRTGKTECNNPDPAGSTGV